MAGLTIPYQAPIVCVPGPQGSPLVQPYTAHAAVHDSNIVTLGVNTAGQIDPAVSNDNSSLLLGIAMQDYQSVYQQLDTGYQAVFGADNVNTGLLPADAGQTLVALFSTPLSVTAINLSQLTGWISGGTYQANIGTQVGLGIDATSGFYYADPNASHKVATVVQKLVGPTTQIVNGQTAQPFGAGGVGDLGARVYIAFLSSVLAPAGGL